MSGKMNGNGRGSGPDRQMLRRALFLTAVCGVAAFALLLARLYQLQIMEHSHYEALAIRQQLREAPGTKVRGSIYDRNYNPLAVSASVDNVYLSPAQIRQYGEDKELIADGLSEILGLDRNDILEKMEKTDSWYVTIARKVEQETAEKVRAFQVKHGLHGLHLETDTKRFYPHSTLGCHVLGFVGTDNYGLEGIEARYDQVLSGSAGRSVRLTDARGIDIPINRFEDYNPGEPGCDMVITLDMAIQYYVEKHLKQAVEDYDIQNGAGAIAMDVNTGAVLAMASLDDYDLNHFLEVKEEAQLLAEMAPNQEEAQRIISEAQSRQWRNKALSDTYEPGSTFKIITLSMALEEGKTNLQDQFYCPGNVNVIGRSAPIRCWKDGGHGSQTLTQAVQHSCNVAFVNLGQRVGAETFYRYCEAFGLLNLTEDPDENLTASTGIDLAGESGSIWWSRNTFCAPQNLSQLAAASFGQTFTITPLQLITAVSACINGGYLMRPYVVEKIVRENGSIQYQHEPECIRQVISEQTSEQVRSILEQVVGDSREGTGRNAAITGYRMGGKTGTSEKVNLEATTGQKEYIVSFIGFAPAEDPVIAILIFLDTPSNRSGVYISGGQMAAPVVGRMMSDILPYLGIEPEQAEAQGDVTMPMLLGNSEREAAEKLEESGLGWRRVGAGEQVTEQLPRAGMSLAYGSETILYFETEQNEEKAYLPDLSGMRYAQARDTLADLGLFISTRCPEALSDGRRVLSQSLRPGTWCERGTCVEVTLYFDDTSMLGRY